MLMISKVCSDIPHYYCILREPDIFSFLHTSILNALEEGIFSILLTSPLSNIDNYDNK